MKEQHMYLLLATATLSTVAVISLVFYLRRKSSEDDDKMDEDAIASSRLFTSELRVPKHAVGAVIGTNGQNIRRLMKETGVRLEFSKREEASEDTEDEREDRILYLKGDRGRVLEAEEKVKEFIAEIPPIITIELYIPQGACGRVIGKGGQNIREICRSSGAKVEVDRNGSLSAKERLVTITGNKIQAEYAELMVKEVVEAFKVSQQKEKQVVEEIVETPIEEENVMSPVMSEFPIVQIPDGEYFHMFVSAFEKPDHFWIQPISKDATQLDQLGEKMTALYNSKDAENAHLKEGKIGDICCAPFALDSDWYRACITGFDKEGNAQLYYIDYGDTGIMPLRSIMKIQQNFIDLPAQAVECYLDGVGPKDGEWSEHAIADFEKLTHCAQWIPLIGKIVSFKNKNNKFIPLLNIVDTNEGKKVDIAEEMVRLGHASLLQGSMNHSTHADSSTGLDLQKEILNGNEQRQKEMVVSHQESKSCEHISQDELEHESQIPVNSNSALHPPMFKQPDIVKEANINVTVSEMNNEEPGNDLRLNELPKEEKRGEIVEECLDAIEENIANEEPDYLGYLSDLKIENGNKISDKLPLDDEAKGYIKTREEKLLTKVNVNEIRSTTHDGVLCHRDHTANSENIDAVDVYSDEVPVMDIIAYPVESAQNKNTEISSETAENNRREDERENDVGHPVETSLLEAGIPVVDIGKGTHKENVTDLVTENAVKEEGSDREDGQEAVLGTSIRLSLAETDIPIDDLGRNTSHSNNNISAQIITRTAEKKDENLRHDNEDKKCEMPFQISLTEANIPVDRTTQQELELRNQKEETENRPPDADAHDDQGIERSVQAPLFLPVGTSESVSEHEELLGISGGKGVMSLSKKTKEADDDPEHLSLDREVLTQEPQTSQELGSFDTGVRDVPSEEPKISQEFANNEITAPQVEDKVPENPVVANAAMFLLKDKDTSMGESMESLDSEEGYALKTPSPPSEHDPCDTSMGHVSSKGLLDEEESDDDLCDEIAQVFEAHRISRNVSKAANNRGNNRYSKDAGDTVLTSQAEIMKDTTEPRANESVDTGNIISVLDKDLKASDTGSPRKDFATKSKTFDPLLTSMELARQNLLMLGTSTDSIGEDEDDASSYVTARSFLTPTVQIDTDTDTDSMSYYSAREDAATPTNDMRSRLSSTESDDYDIISTPVASDDDADTTLTLEDRSQNLPIGLTRDLSKSAPQLKVSSRLSPDLRQGATSKSATHPSRYVIRVIDEKEETKKLAKSTERLFGQETSV